MAAGDLVYTDVYRKPGAQYELHRSSHLIDKNRSLSLGSLFCSGGQKNKEFGYILTSDTINQALFREEV